jgi:hypothetical protein
MLYISSIFYVSFLMFIWYESDIVVTIAKILNLENKLLINDYKKERLVFPHSYSYADFLYATKPNFVTKLLSCPICLCFWMTVFKAVVFTMFFKDVIYMNVLLFPISYLLSLFIYLILKKKL